MPEGKIIKLHVHTGKTRLLRVVFCVRVCQRVPVHMVKLVIQDILSEAGASARAVKSVTVVPAPPIRSA